MPEPTTEYCVIYVVSAIPIIISLLWLWFQFPTEVKKEERGRYDSVAAINKIVENRKRYGYDRRPYLK